MPAQAQRDDDPLRFVVAVMDRLRSPGGCPWDAEQTHESLARYLVEETYEVLDAIEEGDPALLREELGDVLLQVLFHARLAQERRDGQAFGIDDVAADLAAKMIRRHPHVFAQSEPGGDRADGESGAVGVAVTADEVNLRWEQQKAQEKARTSVTDGVPMGLPALALAGKLVSRAQRAGLDDVVRRAGSAAEASSADAPANDAGEQARIGAALLAVVQEAAALGIDPESALRATARRLRDDLISAEQHGG